MRPLEEIVEEHPLPWEGSGFNDYLVETAPGEWDAVLTRNDGGRALADAAPAMALAIRALLAVMRAPHIDRNPAIVDTYLVALRASLPEEFRP